MRTRMAERAGVQQRLSHTWRVERSHADVLDATCPARRALDLVADKWTVLVIYGLSGGSKRHMELRRAVDGITQKMLTQTLRKLENAGLVERTTHPTVPPAVEYTLTPLGETLVEPLNALCRWAEENMEAVERGAPFRKTHQRQPDYEAVRRALELIR
jgi:DNA-binding HxlR family transcriptional regulator